MAEGSGRALRAYTEFRRTQLAELGMQKDYLTQRRLQKTADEKAAQEAAEKVADEKAGQSIGELNKAVSDVLGRIGTYDETGRIRAEVWDGQIEPLLGQLGSIKSKTWDGLEYVNSIRLRTAHRMPEPTKETPASQLSDEEGFLQDYFAAEEANVGHPLSAAERISARSRGTAEYARLKASGTTEGKESDLPRDEQIKRRAERMLTNPLFQLKPEEALKRSTQFQDAFEQYQQNPDFFKQPVDTSQSNAPAEPGGLEKLLGKIKALFGGEKKKPAAQPAAEPETVAVDINDPSLMEDRSDINERGIDINAKAEDEGAPEAPKKASFNYFEELQDYLKKKLDTDKDTSYYNSVLSAGGRRLPKRKNESGKP